MSYKKVIVENQLWVSDRDGFLWTNNNCSRTVQQDFTLDGEELWVVYDQEGGFEGESKDIKKAIWIAMDNEKSAVR